MSINNILMSTFREIAMESDEENAVVISDAELDDTIDGFEEEDAGAELSEIEGAIDVTSSAIDGMEALHDAVEECQKNGGLDSQAAALLNVAVESVMRPFGGTTSKSMPALESYEGDGGRATATGFALESIADTLKSMWEAIVGMFVKAYAAVKAWLIKTFTKLGRIKSAAVALSKKANETKLTAKKEEKIKLGSAHVWGGVPNTAAISKLPAEIASVSTGFMKSQEALILGINKMKGAKVEDIPKLAEEAADMYEKKLTGNGWSKSGSTYTNKNATMGGALKVELGDNGFISEFTSTSKSDDTVAPLKASEAAAIADAVGGAAGKIMSNKSLSDDLSKVEGDMKKAGDALMHSLRTTGDTASGVRAAVKDTLREMQKAGNSQRKAVVALTSSGTVLLSSALSFANASLKNLKEA